VFIARRKKNKAKRKVLLQLQHFCVSFPFFSVFPFLFCFTFSLSSCVGVLMAVVISLSFQTKKTSQTEKDKE